MKLIKLSIEEVEHRIFQKHGDKIHLIKDTYVNTRTKCKFYHSEYGEWMAAPFKVMNGQGHPDGKNKKRIDTFIKKYGVDHPNKTAAHRKNLRDKHLVPLKKIIEKLFAIYGSDVILVENTYMGISEKATFIHKIYGEWISIVDNVLRGHSHQKASNNKRKKTCIEKYGVDSPSKVASISLRQAKSSNNSYIKYHWKTREELVCQGSWEAKVIDYLNTNKIDFEWQPKVFIMPNGKTYRPDCYLIKEDKWIEVKGWMRKDAQIKWDWFQSIMPNSELWNKEKLKELKILPSNINLNKEIYNNGFK